MQPRVKADIIFEAIAIELDRRRNKLDRLRYQRYLVAVHAFSRKKSQERSVERKRIASALVRAETEKKKLVSQRAEMISRDLFDKHSREQFEASIEELSDTVDDLRYRRRQIS